MPTLPSIAIGTASANAAHAADLGKTITVDGKIYRLVKAGAAITVGTGGLCANTAATSGTPTWVVTLPSAANSAFVAGVIPGGQKDSTGAAGLLNGDYFYIQVSGVAEVTAGAAIASGALIASLITTGKVDDAAATAGVGAIGVALEAAAADGDVTGCLLKGLI